ncbi:MAG: chromosome segregation protein SMC [Firmicutes bacterium]|jgi:chromosome segregation protein|nr:chromosome segregation protein SMC [Bacillota bacterium]
MHLKSLTLKGFKSFAEATTLELEPGITVIVGPNGSGKSNVVDGVAWVLGAQGPKAVRSGKMDDVIFAGSAKRPALGRAEVTLTIDNSSKKLPLDVNEINITRTLFRTGDSEYQINGTSCRLLDIQELLSDAGVGRTQHIIISQGQLDAILQATQEERRGVIEEAAGILKYRKRKERAERRLESSESSMQRLEDLRREVKRQIRPLERQATAAQRYGEITKALGAVGIYLAGRELATLEAKLSASQLELTQLLTARTDMENSLEEQISILSAKQDILDQNDYGDKVFLSSRVGQLFEQSRGLKARFAERLRNTDSALLDARSRPDTAKTQTLLREAGEEQLHTEEEIKSLLVELERISVAEEELAQERRSYLEERAAQSLADDSSDLQLGKDLSEESRQGATSLAKELSRRVSELRSSLSARRSAWSEAKETQTRLLERLSGVDQRLAEASQEAARLELARDELIKTVEESLEKYHLAADSLALAESESEKVNKRMIAITAELHGARAKAEALEFALNQVRSRAGIEYLTDNKGVLGTLLDLVDMEEEIVRAFEAALGDAIGSAVLVKAENAKDALEILSSKKMSGTVLPVPLYGKNRRSSPSDSERGQDIVHIRQFVTANDPEVSELLDCLLEEVWLCRGDLDTAVKAYLSDPTSTIVTVDGSCFSPSGWRLGAKTLGVTQAAFDRASRSIAELENQTAEEERLYAHTAAILRSSRDESEAANKKLIEEKSQLERLERSVVANRSIVSDLKKNQVDLAAKSRSVEAELELLTTSLTEEEMLLKNSEAQAEVLAAQAAREAELLTERAKYLEEERNRERSILEGFDRKGKAHMVLRRDLEVRAASLEERHKNLASRQKDLEEVLRAQLLEFEKLNKAEPALLVKRSIMMAFSEEANEIFNFLNSKKQELEAENTQKIRQRDEALQEIKALRSKRQEMEKQLTDLSEQAAKVEITIAETKTRIEAQQSIIMTEFGVTGTEAADAPRPEIPSGMSAHDYQKYLRRELGSLGPVNSLAEEELRQLRERETFLETQLNDIKKARKELDQVIRAIDKEIEEVFFKAYSDVADHFEKLFSSLFPGGQGRLSLTFPNDLLNTGIEIEARPAGRNVRRLSLLSGGERSLVAMAFLFAVFRSRPSPFYLMDEVEAALDEVNLKRFLRLVEEFRDEAQLIIVSHQKKTMEIADALYGISMAPGASSKAISEKVQKKYVASQEVPA